MEGISTIPMKLCKVRFDGEHYMFMPLSNLTTSDNIEYSDEEIVKSSKKGLGLEDNQSKLDFFTNTWRDINFPFSRSKKLTDEDFEDYEDEMQLYIIELYNSLKNEIKNKRALINKVVDQLVLDYGLFLDEDIYKQVESIISNQKNNLKIRKKLFRRKALNNDWNYFVTFTYDDKKHNEETFVKTLKKKLQNLHTRNGWLYMGCFERSKTERLHFHGLVYVPEGKMSGQIIEEEYYDITAHKKNKSYINTEFEDKIGRNDFKPISKCDITFNSALDYIIKYIGKENERVVYSRGLKDDFYALVDYTDNVICDVSSSSPYKLLGNTRIIELTKELEIKE